jgi:hypothetical protein
MGRVTLAVGIFEIGILQLRCCVSRTRRGDQEHAKDKQTRNQGCQ